MSTEERAVDPFPGAQVERIQKSNGKAERRSLVATMAEHYGMDNAQFFETIKATLMPQNTSNEAVAAFLVVANKYGLNPFTREIYAFPDSKSGGVRPIVSIDGWAKLVNDQDTCDGFELADVFNTTGELEAVEARFFRKDRKHPVVLREYLVECNRGTEPWKKWPRRMLRHKAFIQGARLAFGFSGIEDEDEIERVIEAQEATIHHPRPSAKQVRTMDLTTAKPAAPQDPPGGSAMPKSAPASEPVKLPEYYHSIEIVGVAAPETWLDEHMVTDGRLDGMSYRAAASSTDKGVAAERLAVLNAGAQLQADNGNIPPMYARLAAACWLHDNGKLS